MARTGRPVIFTEDHDCWEQIFRDIGNGSTIRKALKDTMDPTTFYDCLETYPNLSQQYARAREKKARILLDDVEQIANDRSEDTFIDEKGITRINNAAVQRDRLRVGAIQWRAEKELSGEYGNKITVDNNINVSLRGRLSSAKERLVNPVQNIGSTDSTDILQQLPIVDKSRIAIDNNDLEE
jgi:hypothetical protein